MNQKNQSIIIALKNDRSVIIMGQKHTYKHNTSTHPHPLDIQFLFLYRGIITM